METVQKTGRKGRSEATQRGKREFKTVRKANRFSGCGFIFERLGWDGGWLCGTYSCAYWKRKSGSAAFEGEEGPPVKWLCVQRSTLISSSPLGPLMSRTDNPVSQSCQCWEFFSLGSHVHTVIRNYKTFLSVLKELSGICWQFWSVLVRFFANYSWVDSQDISTSDPPLR